MEQDYIKKTIPDSLKDLDTQELDLVMEENDFFVYYKSSPFLTPLGKKIKSNNKRFLHYIINELHLKKYSNSNNICGYGLLAYQKDIFEKKTDGFDTVELIENDRFIKNKFKQENNCEEKFEITNVFEYFEYHKFPLSIIYEAVGNITRTINQYILDKGIKIIDFNKSNLKEFTNVIENEYSNLPLQKKSVVNILNTIHGAGLTLPLFLVLQKISPSEYACSLLNFYLQDFKSKKVDFEKPREILETLINDTRNVFEYLSYFEEEKIKDDITELIRKGENSNLEFKSTLRWNIKAGKKDTAIEHACLKTISAFLNSSGGTLLIGVQDNGEIEGIQTDNFLNDDKFLLHFWNLVKDSIGQDTGNYIKTEIKKIEDKSICIVECIGSPTPVFLKQKGFDEEFYIRIGPQSSKLTITEALKYIDVHFGKR
jgi:hypothetical protein